MSAPYVAVGLTGEQADVLLADRALVARWDSLPLAFTVVGIDRLDRAHDVHGATEADDAAPRRITLESSVATTFLAKKAPRSRFLCTASSRRDHPYNLARRVASAGHLSQGRIGVLLGPRDPYVPAGDQWSHDDVSVDDIAHAVRVLEQTWPFESVVADRASGIFVESDRIQFADLEEPYRIAGPLTVPEPATGPSVIAAYHSGAREIRANTDVDLVVGPAVAVREMSSTTAPPTEVAGILLRDDDLSPETLADVAEKLLATSQPIAPGLSLRAALELPAPPRVARRAAFARPEPLVAS